MASTYQPGISACPACDAAPMAEALAENGSAGAAGRLMLAVPGAHCGACISTIERTLEATPGVRSARVNLTLRRVTVDAAPSVTAESLIPVLAAAGYEAQELDATMLRPTETDRRSRELLMRLGVAGFAMMNVMLLSVAVWSGASDATRDMFHWISAAIALPVVAYAGQPFFVSAWTALKVRRLNMDVPISLAILLASGMSLAETMQGGEQAYFDAALSLTFFLLAGRWLDHRTRAAARSAAETLAALDVQRVTMADGRVVPQAELRPGDLVRVMPGARMPVDGIITEGASELDRSALTGESLPVGVEEGARVTAGETNLTGALTVRVTAAGKDSTLHRMADLVALAETARNRYTSLADRAARIYAPAVHLLAAAAFVFWFLSSGDARLALNIAVAVLIITCPCALGLAVPAVVTAASGRLYRHGLLIKNATALERLAEVDHVVFDKTGTLTLGRPVPDPLPDDPEALSVALALAEGSAHPLAQALAEAAQAAGVQAAALSDRVEVPGHGVQALWQGQEVRLGRAEWTGGDAARDGAGVQTTATWLQLPGRRLAFTFTDRLRPGAAEMVAELQARGLTVELLSGDSAGAVAAVAEQLGITDWQAGLLPEAKAARLAQLADEGRRVLMVGDGLNDTLALASAHASISPATALEAARVVSDVVLLGQSLAPIPDALRTARSATRRIVENFGLAATYNMIAVPLALAGLATPLAAALAMSSSSIMVSLNALRLR
ncbi:heavy metal translocating P-type ATPase [Frigidibacter sp. ROC022]|uniref:heavy metal translocating P-type ATPase n=1 Tax=Frigidibacter sp. ROC022 TaxID=2971796 RepID=UPI00215AFE9C|nr:heavy metal translocating P-type ATPase [Frigidibacter sp. ROC022]MCR8724211.1 heavy metal translocating P-type ATPase [Frigidibacter sp. ROC022]